MWKTVLILLVTIVVIPLIAFRFDEPLSGEQGTMLTRLALIYLSGALLCFVISTLSRNYSQVDKLWSIMPVVYTWVAAFGSGFEPRILLMAVLATVWGIRLSYNFARKGGYSLRFWSGREDYRWAVLKARPEFAIPWKWILFNFFFISLYQMGLILLMTLPAVRSMGGKPVSLADWILTGLFIVLVVIETAADQQQWKFQKEKHRLGKAGQELSGAYRKGFVHRGLWGMVRHPNYAAEQAIWIVFYCFSVSASGRWINWSVMGIVLLLLLFWSSSNFSESISMGKYPAYEEYRKKVPRFIPFIR